MISRHSFQTDSAVLFMIVAGGDFGLAYAHLGLVSAHLGLAFADRGLASAHYGMVSRTLATVGDALHGT